MSLKTYIFGMIVSTLFCWAAFGMIVWFLAPDSAGFLGFLLFYVSLFFAVAGTMTLVGYYVRVWLSKNEVVFSHVSTSFRQGMLLGLFVCGALAMSAAELLSVWTGALFFVIIGLTELFFTARNRAELR